MPDPTRDRIRRIFLHRRPNFALVSAAELLGITRNDLKRDIEDGAIVAVSTGVGLRIPKEELIAAAMRRWEQRVIEAALGDDAARVLPEAIRLVLLRVRVPRYQRDMLVALAQRHWMSVDEVLTRELEDVASAHAEELAAAVPRSARRWLGPIRRDAALGSMCGQTLAPRTVMVPPARRSRPLELRGKRARRRLSPAPTSSPATASTHAIFHRLIKENPSGTN